MDANCGVVSPSLVNTKEDLCSEEGSYRVELHDNLPKNVHSLVHAAESMIQNGIEAMWAKVLEVLQQKKQEYELKRVEYEQKIVTLMDQLNNTDREKCTLDKSNIKLIDEVDNLTRQKRLLEEQLQATLCQLLSKEDELKEERDMRRTKEKEDCLQQKQLKEQSHMLREYQDKVTMTTGKMQKLSQQIKNDRGVNERMKKSHANEITLQSTETKKLALEVSRLKLQISTVSKSLAVSKDNSEKLTQQLQTLKDESVSNMAGMEKRHLHNVRILQEKISSLQQEIEKLKLHHHYEIEQLKKYCAEVERNDFIDARIAFLQHQNRQEKVKITKES